MRSLFAKMFISFWLTVVLVGLTLYLNNLSRRRYEARLQNISTQLAGAEWQAKMAPELAITANSAAAAFEQGGRPQLERALNRQQVVGVRKYFFDATGQPLLVYPEIPGSVRESAADGRSRMTTAVQDARGPSGRAYRLIFWNTASASIRFETVQPFAATRNSPGALDDQSPWLFLAGVLAIGGVVCWFLTRHITHPLQALGAAADGIASGALTTRIAPTIARRHDEIGALARDFDAMAARIDGLVSSQRRLLRDVSHELRSPLARLALAADLVRQAPAEEAGELFTRIRTEVRRLDHLIGQLLSLARLDDGLPVEGTVVDLAELTEQIAADAGFEARACGREVRLVRADGARILGEPELLRGALENVVRNAVRHTAPATTVEMELTRAGNSARFTVRDHGPGVLQSRLAEIFLPFYRGAENGGGAGLGLAIAERIVLRYDGTIAAANAPGGGLAVEIVLPLKRDALLRARRLVASTSCTGGFVVSDYDDDDRDYSDGGADDPEAPMAASGGRGGGRLRNLCRRRLIRGRCRSGYRRRRDRRGRVHARRSRSCGSCQLLRHAEHSESRYRGTHASEFHGFGTHPGHRSDIISSIPTEPRDRLNIGFGGRAGSIGAVHFPVPTATGKSFFAGKKNAPGDLHRARRKR